MSSASHAWSARPVFITSTFRDMQAERDHLRDHVFPVLEERLRERRRYLEPIDLRWSFDRLAGAVQERIGYDARGGALFVARS